MKKSCLLQSYLQKMIMSKIKERLNPIENGYRGDTFVVSNDMSDFESEWKKACEAFDAGDWEAAF